MKISHSWATSIEGTVRYFLGCEYQAYGGLVDADVYETHPLEAAVLLVGIFYRHKHDEEIAAFFRKWRTAFQSPEDNPECTPELYNSELSNLIKMIQTI